MLHGVANRYKFLQQYRAPVIVAAIFLAVLAVFLLVFGVPPEQVVVTLTGLILVWYTWETHRLRVESAKQVEATLRQAEEMSRQIELQHRPLVVIDHIRPFEPEPWFLLSNLGNGTALWVKVQDVEIRSDDWCIVITFPDEISILQKGESRRIKATTLFHGQPRMFDLSTHLPPDRAIYNIAVKYQNIEGTVYLLQERLGPDGPVIISHSRPEVGPIPVK